MVLLDSGCVEWAKYKGCVDDPAIKINKGERNDLIFRFSGSPCLVSVSNTTAIHHHLRKRKNKIRVSY